MRYIYLHSAVYWSAEISVNYQYWNSKNEDSVDPDNLNPRYLELFFVSPQSSSSLGPTVSSILTALEKVEDF